MPKTNIKTLMESLHLNAIKELTYLILNKRKLDNKQTPVPPIIKIKYSPPEPTS